MLALQLPAKQVARADAERVGQDGFGRVDGDDDVVAGRQVNRALPVQVRRAAVDRRTVGGDGLILLMGYPIALQVLPARTATVGLIVRAHLDTDQRLLRRPGVRTRPHRVLICGHEDVRATGAVIDAVSHAIAVAGESDRTNKRIGTGKKEIRRNRRDVQSTELNWTVNCLEKTRHR